MCNMASAPLFIYCIRVEKCEREHQNNIDFTAHRKLASKINYSLVIFQFVMVILGIEILAVTVSIGAVSLSCLCDRRSNAYVY